MRRSVRLRVGKVRSTTLTRILKRTLKLTLTWLRLNDLLRRVLSTGEDHNVPTDAAEDPYSLRSRKNNPKNWNVLF